MSAELATPDPPGGVVETLSKRWKVIIAFAGGAVALIATFVLAPPFPLTESEGLSNLLKVVVAIIVAVLLVPLVNLRRRKDWSRWAGAAVVTTLLSVTILFLYWNLEGLWIRTFHIGARSHKVVIGTNMFPSKVAFRQQWLTKKGVWLSDDDMINRSSGRADLLWPADEIRHHSLILVAIYLLTVTGFASSVVLATQAASCVAQKSKPS